VGLLELDRRGEACGAWNCLRTFSSANEVLRRIARRGERIPKLRSNDNRNFDGRAAFAVTGISKIELSQAEDAEGFGA